jgi:hypothetical protein
LTGPSHPQRLGGLTRIAEMRKRYGWDDQAEPDFAAPFVAEDEPGFVAFAPDELAAEEQTVADVLDLAGPARPDPRPVARLRDEKVLPRGERRCCATNRTDDIHRHHLVERDAGGDDVVENLVWLNKWTHDNFHYGAETQRRLVGHKIRLTLTEDQVAYILSHRRGGPAFLERVYPLENPLP